MIRDIIDIVAGVMLLGAVLWIWDLHHDIRLLKGWLKEAQVQRTLCLEALRQRDIDLILARGRQWRQDLPDDII